MNTWDRAQIDFADHLAQTSRSTATCEGYLKHLGWLADSATEGLWELTTGELATWLDSRPWSQGTRRKVVVSLRLFYAWAVANGRCDWAPTAGLSSAAPRTRGPAKRPLPDRWMVEVEAWVAWARSSGRGEGTLSVRTFWLGRLAEVSADPYQVTTQQLAEWLSNPDWAPETRRAARSSVRTFYRWATKVGRISESPAEDLDPVLLPRALPRPAPDAAIRDALATADERIRLALKLACFAGLRRAEIAMLHASQVNETEILVIGKAGHHRRVPINPDLADELRSEMARRRRGEPGSGFPSHASATGWLFPSDRVGLHMTPAHLGRLMSQALPEVWTAHNLRHRFATAVYAVERDILTVQQLLGHAKPETTARYAQVPDSSKVTAVAAIGLR